MINIYRKEFTFDLDTKNLIKYFGFFKYRRAYYILRTFFEKRNFEHRQGSVYCSFNAMATHDVFDIISDLRKECPWLKTSLKRMDIANIGDLHEITSFITK